MKKCPVCDSEKYRDYVKFPAYKICMQCETYFQLDPCEKIYEGEKESFGLGPKCGHLMSDYDKKVNENLANYLYNELTPESVLDIGTKYPYLLSVLKNKCKVLGIDGIEEVIKYGKELGVNTICGDIREIELKDQKFDLITLIHVIEHFYDLKSTIEKILSHLSNDGVLFVRTPTPDVTGIERDLTDHHLSIHPNLFTEKSIKYLFNSLNYEVYRVNKMEGSGQTDFWIRKKVKDLPTLSVCMIVKNEEFNISDAINSIKDIADEIIIVDTGSIDNTKVVVQKSSNKVKIYDFKWCDDFSAARNYSLEKATCDYIFWLDSDDVVENPKEILKVLKQRPNACYFNILYGNERFCHCRMFKNHKDIYFKGRVHEHPDTKNYKIISTNVNIRHKVEKHSTEDRSERNQRILEKELKDKPNDSRTLFYLGNTLKDQGKYKEAIKIYNKYLKVATWKDERFMAQKYIGQINLWQKKYDEAIKEFLKAIGEDDKWREPYYYIGECYYLKKQYLKCINWMKLAISISDHDSVLFKEKAVYEELPFRYLFACYEVLEDYINAEKYCKIASDIKPNDKWLKDRVKYFDYKARAVGSRVIECYRQGALGDCLMTTAALKGLKEKYQNHNDYIDCYIRYITHPSSFPILEGNKYIDELATESKGDADETILFSYPEDEGYPDNPLDRHLVKIFNECAGLPDNDLQLECTLDQKEEEFGIRLNKEYQNYITLHIQPGWSEYKEWYDDRWEEVVRRIKDELSYYKVVQLGHKEDRLIKGVEDYRGHTIKEAVSLIKHADLHLGVDSFTNHVTNAVGTPAVILFGSTSPVGSGYDQNINIYKDLDCQPCYKEYSHISKASKGPCKNCKKCMDSITVDEVMENIQKILKVGKYAE